MLILILFSSTALDIICVFALVHSTGPNVIRIDCSRLFDQNARRYFN